MEFAIKILIILNELKITLNIYTNGNKKFSKKFTKFRNVDEKKKVIRARIIIESIICFKRLFSLIVSFSLLSIFFLLFFIN